MLHPPLPATPRVTIALPIYNSRVYLALAVHSVLRQSFTDWELLIIDDGSTDGGIEKLRNLNDPRITIMADGTNKGLACRLNQAIDMARGRFFARMDHDDICHPDRLQRQVEYLLEHPDVDLLSTRCATIDAEDRVTGALPYAGRHEEICRWPWIGFYMPHPTWVGRIEWFRRHRYREPGPYCSEDQELLLRASSYSRYESLPNPLLAYRLRTVTPWRKQWRTRIALARVQSGFFSGRRQYLSVLLSWGAAAVRLLQDAAGHLLPMRRFGHRAILSQDDRQAWEKRIEALKASFPARE